MGHLPVCVILHGNKQVEHKQCGDDGKDKVDDAKREGQVHLIVGRPINDGEEKLKGAALELSQIDWVLCLEKDINVEANPRITRPPAGRKDSGLQIPSLRSAWLVQSVKHATLDL